ncbi:MAG: hypothetical protein EBX52_01180 [Proteobacteria bacterium]|nr:hypothetical protein [Pseudomonadota bacterium]
MKHPTFFVPVFLFLPLAALAQTSPDSAIQETVQTIRTAIHKNPITPESCPVQLASLTAYIRSLDPRSSGLNSPAFEASGLLRDLFDSRVFLRNEYRALYEKNRLSPECVRAARAAFRHLRGLEDYLGIVGYQKALARALRDQAAARARDEEPQANPPGLFPPVNISPADATRVALPVYRPFDPPVIFPVTTGLPGPSYLPQGTLVNPGLKSAPGLQSGDVLLSRGNANVSALIARMADDDTQFSHLALVYVDPVTGAPYTIEAHIEHGSIVLPLSEWLKDGKVRTVVFRQKDPTLAAAAARMMFESVKRHVDAGNPVEYDFSFNMHDHSKLFCSEIIRAGYELASSNRFEIPAYPSHFSMKNRDLFDRLGISEKESFLPEDIEMDPRFELLAEWRDFRNLGSAIRKDAILTAMVDWMERSHYRFDPSTWQSIKAGLGKILRKAGYMKDKMPTYMSYSAVELSLMVDDIVEVIEKGLAPYERARMQKSGIPFTYVDYEKRLDAIRLATEKSKQGFYPYFHP